MTSKKSEEKSENSYEEFKDRLKEFISKIPDINSLQDNKKQLESAFQPFLDSAPLLQEKEGRIFTQTIKNVILHILYSGWHEPDKANTFIFKAYDDAKSQTRSNKDLHLEKSEKEEETKEGKSEYRKQYKQPIHTRVSRWLSRNLLISDSAIRLYIYYVDKRSKHRKYKSYPDNIYCTCDVTDKDAAYDLGWSPRKLKRAKKELKDNGWIETPYASKKRSRIIVKTDRKIDIILDSIEKLKRERDKEDLNWKEKRAEATIKKFREVLSKSKD